MTPYVLPLHTFKKYGPEAKKKLRTYMNGHLFYIKLIYWLHQIGITSMSHRNLAGINSAWAKTPE